MASEGSSQTIREASPPGASEQLQKLRLDDIEPILVLAKHLDADELHEIEDALYGADAPVTYDVREARIFIGKVSQKKRAVMELRTRGIFTEEVEAARVFGARTQDTQAKGNPPPRIGDKRPHSPIGVMEQCNNTIDLTMDSSTESESEPLRPVVTKARKLNRQAPQSGLKGMDSPANTISVVKLDWLFDSLKVHEKLPLESYLVYSGTVIARPSAAVATPITRTDLPTRATSSVGEYSSKPQNAVKVNTILERAQNEAEPPRPSQISRKRFHGAVEQRDRENAYASRTQQPRLPGQAHSDGVAPLLQQSTTEHDLDLSNDIPEPPEWIKKGYKYACQRSTPVDHPNRKFVDMLKVIRVTRDLIGDEIGIRAYSTAIASISAYPYTLTSPREISALPGCSSRIAALFVEWKNNGEHDVEAVREAKNDSRLQTLRIFFEIWGVGAATAREFYNRGWRDLDDIVEHGWNSISRVQQIGVKFYDEFQQKIPRSEVEQIRDVVHKHAQRVCGEPDGVRTTIVGGCRRGKAESGDADLMVSHLDDARTLDIVDDLADSLHQADWITHSLGTTHSGSRRGQETLAYKGPAKGSGFDTLDKTMVVWQNPSYNEEDAVDGKNPNPHRRVDIIISPWRTIGCAVLGWSAGTTFERDLRRYAKHVKNWKFDSSGIRDRGTGQVVDVEAIGGRAETIEEAERKVFQGLGLEYKEPWERCTG